MKFEVNNLCFSYYKSPLILKDASFSIEEDDKILVLGINGSGKTTLLKVLSGIEESYFGSVKLNEKELASIDNRDKNTSMLYSNPVLLKHKSVEKNIEFLLEVLCRKNLSEDELNLFSIFNLTNQMKTKVSKLSLIDKRKLAIIRSCIKSPEVMFIDDQFDGLNETETVDMINIYNFLIKMKKTIVFAIDQNSFNNNRAEMFNLKFNKIIFLSITKAYEFNSIEDLKLNPPTIDAMNFIDGFNAKNTLIIKKKDDFFIEIDGNLRKFDRKISKKLGGKNLDLITGENAKLFYTDNLNDFSDQQISNKLENGEWFLFSNLDGIRLI
ncbi:MAG: ATP-binding cassette domain-containing protein [Clostridia bacterium]|nr:ATP-binding cassette domain-containing protein [Clostridia bacterium]